MFPFVDPIPPVLSMQLSGVFDLWALAPITFGGMLWVGLLVAMHDIRARRASRPSPTVEPVPARKRLRTAA
jgi:hypothetical protein